MKQDVSSYFLPIAKPLVQNQLLAIGIPIQLLSTYICSIKIGYRTAEPCMKFLLFNVVNKDKETEEWIQNFSALCVYIFWIKYLLIQGKLNDILFSKPFYIWKFGFIIFCNQYNSVYKLFTSYKHNNDYYSGIHDKISLDILNGTS